MNNICFLFDAYPNKDKSISFTTLRNGIHKMINVIALPQYVYILSKKTIGVMTSMLYKRIVPEIIDFSQIMIPRLVKTIQSIEQENLQWWRGICPNQKVLNSLLETAEKTNEIIAICKSDGSERNFLVMKQFNKGPCYINEQSLEQKRDKSVLKLRILSIHYNDARLNCCCFDYEINNNNNNNNDPSYDRNIVEYDFDGEITEFIHFFIKENPDIILGLQLTTLIIPFLLKLLVKERKMHILGRAFTSDTDLMWFYENIKEVEGRSLPSKQTFEWVVRCMTRGRLLCDLALLASDGAIGGKEGNRISFSFNEVIELFNKEEEEVEEEEEVNNERKTKSKSIILMDTLVSSKILELTLEMAQYQGCLWNDTLTNKREKAGDFLLRHQVYPQIVPECLYEKESTCKTFEGGYNFDTQRGCISEESFILDYSSMYPSIMRIFNLSLDFSGFSDPDTIKRKLIPYLERNDKDEEMEDSNGDLCVLATRIIGERRLLEGNRKLIKDINNYEYKRLSRSIRVAKVTINKIFGLTGSKSSAFYNMTLASFITRAGREIIKDTAMFIEREFSGTKPIMGDTDSICVQLTEEEKTKAIKHINSLRPLLQIHEEEHCRKMIILSHKHYIIQLHGSVDDDERETIIKGMEEIKRNRPPVVKILTNQIYNYFFERKDESTTENDLLQIISCFAKQYLSEDSCSKHLELFTIKQKISKSLKYTLEAEQDLLFYSKGITSFGNGMERISFVKCKNGFKSALWIYNIEYDKESFCLDVEWYVQKHFTGILFRMFNVLQIFTQLKLEDIRNLLLQKPIHVDGIIGLDARISPVLFEKTAQSITKRASLHFKCPHCNKSLPTVDDLAKRWIENSTSVNLRIPYTKCEECNVDYNVDDCVECAFDATSLPPHMKNNVIYDDVINFARFLLIDLDLAVRLHVNSSRTDTCTQKKTQLKLRKSCFI